MIQLQIVPADNVYGVWDTVAPFIEASLNVGSGHTTLDQIKLLLTRDMQTLFVFVDEGEIVGAMVTEFMNYPNERVLFITEIGGREIITESLCEQLETWARQNGATSIGAWADAPRARLYKMKCGFTTARHVVEKKL